MRQSSSDYKNVGYSVYRISDFEFAILKVRLRIVTRDNKNMIEDEISKTQSGFLPV